MVTKSINLSEEEAAVIDELVDLTGESEPSMLKRATLRGLRELRIDQAVSMYEHDGEASAAAAVAGLPRVQFLTVLIDRGVELLKDASSLREQVSFLAEALDNDRLRDTVSQERSTRPEG